MVKLHEPVVMTTVDVLVQFRNSHSSQPLSGAPVGNSPTQSLDVALLRFAHDTVTVPPGAADVELTVKLGPVGVLVGVGVGVMVGVFVIVAVGVMVGVLVTVGVFVGVAVGPLLTVTVAEVSARVQAGRV